VLTRRIAIGEKLHRAADSDASRFDALRLYFDIWIFRSNQTLPGQKSLPSQNFLINPGLQNCDIKPTEIVAETDCSISVVTCRNGSENRRRYESRNPVSNGLVS